MPVLKMPWSGVELHTPAPINLNGPSLIPPDSQLWPIHLVYPPFCMFLQNSGPLSNVPLFSELFSAPPQSSRASVQCNYMDPQTKWVGLTTGSISDVPALNIYLALICEVIVQILKDLIKGSGVMEWGYVLCLSKLGVQVCVCVRACVPGL